MKSELNPEDCDICVASSQLAANVENMQLQAFIDEKLTQLGYVVHARLYIVYIAHRTVFMPCQFYFRFVQVEETLLEILDCDNFLCEREMRWDSSTAM